MVPGIGRKIVRGSKSARGAYALLLLVLLLGATPLPAQELHSFVKGSGDDVKDAVWDHEFLKKMKDTLGNSYESLQVVVSSCCSRGFADYARGYLQGDFSVIASRDYNKEEGYLSTNQTARFGSNPDVEKEGLAVGGSVNPRNDPIWYVHGFLGAWIKAMRANANATAQDLFDAAKGGDYNVSRHTANGPKIVADNAGNGLRSKVGDGTRGRNALVWDAFAGGGSEAISIFSGLRGRGYDPNTEWNPSTIELAYGLMGNNDPLEFDGEGLLRRPGARAREGASLPVRYKANRENLWTMIGNLRTGLNANPGMRKALVVLGAHGNSEKRKVDKEPDPRPNESNQGRIMTPGSRTVLALEQEFVDLLLKGAVVPDPTLARSGPAFLTMTTAQESGPLSVQVLIDGVQAGYVQLQGSSGGHSYTLPVEDAVLRTLYTSGAFADLVLEVGFYFASGSFRVATEWDFELGGYRHYGIGLAGPPLQRLFDLDPTPLPPAGTILATQAQPVFPPSVSPPDPAGLAFDSSRQGGIVWATDQNRTWDPNQPSLFAITASVPHVLLTTIVLKDSACISNPGVPVTSGHVNGISMVPSRVGFCEPRTILGSDFNGDLQRFDDNLFEIDPDVPAPVAGTANLRNVWYLDSGSCPTLCRPNTNSNVPQARIDPVNLVVNMGYIPGETGDGRRQVLLGSMCGDYRVLGCRPANTILNFCELTEGSPGSWRILARYGESTGSAPFQYAPMSATYDPDTQSYFFADCGDGAPTPSHPSVIYQLRFNQSNRSWRVLQSFPGWDGRITGMAVIRSGNPVGWMKVTGRNAVAIASVTTGTHALVLEQQGGSVRLRGGAPNAGKPFVCLAAMSRQAGFDLPDRERRIDLDPDFLFGLSLSGALGNSGTLNASGTAAFAVPALPSGFPVFLQAILLGNPNECDFGLDLISEVLAYATP